MKSVKNIMVIVLICTVNHCFSVGLEKPYSRRTAQLKRTQLGFQELLDKNKNKFYPVWEDLLDGVDESLVKEAQQQAQREKMNMRRAADELCKVVEARIRLVCDKALRNKRSGFQPTAQDVQKFIDGARRDIKKIFGIE